MTSVVKSGYLRKHSKSIISGGWNRVWVVLYQDTNLVVYKKQGDSSPMGKINMFEVKKWFAYGQYTSGMPERPDPPRGETFDKIIGIPQKPSKKAKIHWFLADTEADVHAWMDAICRVLPPPPQAEATASSSAPVQQQQYQPVSSAPPPYPGGPGPSLGFDGMAAGGPAMPQAGAVPQQAYAPQPSYPQQAYPQQQAAYPQQPYAAYPQQQAYPQQPGYSQQPGYPQQAYYQPPPGAYPQQAYPQQHGAYPQQQPYYAPRGGYYQQPHTTVIVQQKPQKKGFMSSNSGNLAMGLVGGAALGYGMSRMGGGLMGWGMRGSWSSLSSFGSFGSCGSFSSFGSF